MAGEIVMADREDGQPPQCRYGDGPCYTPGACTRAGRCLEGHGIDATYLTQAHQRILDAAVRRAFRMLD